MFETYLGIRVSYKLIWSIVFKPMQIIIIIIYKNLKTLKVTLLFNGFRSEKPLFFTLKSRTR